VLIDPRVRDAAKRALVFATTWFALHTLFIVIDGLHDRAGHADVAVVLGNTVEPDGTPSPRLRARLDRAVELYRRGLVPLVMVSGGFGREGFEEAYVMAAYVEAAGIPRAHIVVDRDGIDTEHTAINAARMMRARGIDSAIAVSQFFHLTRTKRALRNAGIAHVSSAHARYFEPRDAYSTVREFFGFYAYLLRG
jgi:vancomycin permeability regulator SanA